MAVRWPSGSTASRQGVGPPPTLARSAVSESGHQQEHYLRDHGCDEMQGFYYSRGVPTEDVVRTVQQISVF
jgi:hypothetical protein